VSQATDISFMLAVIAYSMAATLFFVDLIRRSEPAGLPLWARRVLAGGGVCHLVDIVTASIESHRCPVLTSLPLGVSLTALVVVALYLWLARLRRMDAVGSLIAPLVLTLLVGTQFMHASASTPSPPPMLLAAHVTANLLGLALFLTAAGIALFYLLQAHRLKRKKLGKGTGRLPPLDVLDRAQHRLLVAGFPLLTIGIVTGAAFTPDLLETSGATVLRSLLAVAAWVLLAAVLLLRRAVGWTGRRAAWGTIAGAVCMLLVMAVYALRPVVGSGQ
jgi:ABC-type uncharacterized transport system permease subunit